MRQFFTEATLRQRENLTYSQLGGDDSIQQGVSGHNTSSLPHQSVRFAPNAPSYREIYDPLRNYEDVHQGSLLSNLAEVENNDDDHPEISTKSMRSGIRHR